MLEPAQLTRIGQRHAALPGVDRAPGTGERQLADSPPIVVVPTNEKGSGQPHAQRPPELIGTDRVGLVDGADQARAFRGEPTGGVGDHSCDHRLVRPPAGAGFQRRGKGGPGHGPPSLLGQRKPSPEGPIQRGEAAGVALLSRGHFASVGAQQVVEAVSQPPRLIARHLEQVLVDQSVHQLLSPQLRDVEQGCGHPRREVGHLEQPEQAEGTSSHHVQSFVAARQAGAHFQIAEPQGVQPRALVGQIRFQPGQRPVRSGTQPGARNPDRQRQEAAEPDDLPRRDRLCGDPSWARNSGEQLDGLVERENIQIDPLGTAQAG